MGGRQGLMQVSGKGMASWEEAGELCGQRAICTSVAAGSPAVSVLRLPATGRGPTEQSLGEEEVPGRWATGSVPREGPRGPLASLPRINTQDRESEQHTTQQTPKERGKRTQDRESEQHTTQQTPKERASTCHNMRITTFALVLVLLAGTQARHFWQRDEPQQTPIEHLREALHTYMEMLKAGATEAVSQIDASTLAQKLDLKVEEIVQTITTAVSKVQEDVSPQVEALKGQLAEAENLLKELNKELDPLRAKVQPFLDSFREKFHQDLQAFWAQLEPVGQELRQAAHQQLEAVKQKLQPMAEELRDKTRAHMDELRKNLAPYGEEIRQKFSERMQQLRDKGYPELTQYQAQAREQLSALREKITPIFETFQAEVAPLVEKSKGQLQNVLASLQRTLEQHLQAQQQQQQQS